jgi:hypothetical protein
MPELVGVVVPKVEFPAVSVIVAHEQKWLDIGGVGDTGIVKYTVRTGF